MIDSLNFTIPKQIDLDIIPNRTHKTHDSSGTILYYSGNLGPLKVIVKPYNNTTKIYGSIRKYFLGETELRDLTFSELSNAINKLRKDLRLSHAEFSESIITRIDVGTTIAIEGNINDYFNAIISYPRLEKITYDDSIEFKSTYKKLIFYNKVVKETIFNRGNKLTYNGEQVNAENLLRFEIQYRRVSALKNQLEGIRTINQILDQSHILWDLVLTEFARVAFSSTGILDPNFRAEDTSQGLTALILFAYKGTKEPEHLVKEWYARGIIKYDQKRSIQKKLKEMSEKLILDKDFKNPLLQELTIKIFNSSLPYYIVKHILEVEQQSKSIDLSEEIEV